MQRSVTQTLYRSLPSAVFDHTGGFIAKVDHITGEKVSINRAILLEELASELERWHPTQRGIPDPRVTPDEFEFLEPQEVVWDVYPLTFECGNPKCRRVARYWTQKQLLEATKDAGVLACRVCRSKVRMRQLRYLTAHNCGRMDPLHTPKCPACGQTADMFLEDQGSFRSSTWRCRRDGAAVGTRFTPCNCGRYGRFQQGYTARDQHLWYPQLLTTLNISSQTYDHVQRNPQRGIASLASWLGDEPELSVSLRELERADGGQRTSPEEWEELERRLVAAQVPAPVIEEMRANHAPATTGIAAILADVRAEVIEAAKKRTAVERAGLFDRRIIEDRLSFADVQSEAQGAMAEVAANTSQIIASLGIGDVSVTQQFPILIASFGYTRVKRTPGQADLKSYAHPHHYDGKTPIFTVPANTEALVVTLNAKSVLGFLASEGVYTEVVPDDERTAKLQLATLLAQDVDVGTETAAGRTRRLVHSVSHALLRALDDGQSGFGESSLAEWIVPDVLTTAIYVASYKTFTLGAFDIVLRRRIAPWLLKAADEVNRCDNDPMCSHVSPERPHAACDRCLHLSYGCRSWNADLDRRILRRFWLWTQRQARA